MYTLSIEHQIVDFETWKAAFDRDPAQRERSGVLAYRVFQPRGDPKYVIVQLDFAGVGEAEAFQLALERVWSRVELSPGLPRDTSPLGDRPRARILEARVAHSY